MRIFLCPCGLEGLLNRDSIPNKYFPSKNSGFEKANRNGSGLDYSKIVLLDRDESINWKSVVLIDSAEFRETRKNIETIVRQALQYMEFYIAFQQEMSPLSDREDLDLFQYPSLQYFHPLQRLDPPSPIEKPSPNRYTKLR